MLAYGVELLKAVIPTSIADSYLPTSSNNKPDDMESTLPPLTPFCCVSAIPSSFRYLAELLPASTSHNILAKPLTSTPLITAFLTYITNCYHNPHEPRPKEIIRPSATNLYYAIIQLTMIKSAAKLSSDSPSTAPQSSKLPRLAHLTSHRASATGTSRFAPVGESFTDIMLTPESSSSSSQYTHPNSSSQELSQDNTKDKETRYFVPIENSRESTILNENQKLKGGKSWKEISEQDAMESLRFPGTGIRIGDGENWKELERMETVVCRGHSMEFEMRAWVKEL